MDSPYINAVPKNPDGFMMAGYPYQVSNGQRLQAYMTQAQLRQEALARFLVSRGMPLEDANAFVWRMSGLSGFPQPDMDRNNYIAEDWLRRYTNKYIGVPPSTQYLEYKGKIQNNQATNADIYDRLIGFKRACDGKKVKNRKLGDKEIKDIFKSMNEVVKRIYQQ